jgi:hypothetical protein
MDMNIRIAFREEGNYWKAYLAQADSMEGAMLIGLIPLAAASEGNPLKQKFTDLMKEVLTDFMVATGAEIEGWNDPVSAPPHERMQ